MIERTPPRKWNEKTDVIAIDSGFAGLAAAIEAKQAGSSTILATLCHKFCANMILLQYTGAKFSQKLRSEKMAPAGQPMRSSLVLGFRCQVSGVREKSC